MPDDELHESPLSPADDERIRRLLAEARHAEPMPDAVVARLDRVIAGLAAERASQTNVVDLTARRRRTAGQLLVAAAAVVAVGVGISQVLPNAGGGSADSPSAATAEDNAEAGADGGGAEQQRSGTPEAGPEAPSATTGDATKSSIRISPEAFGRDVRRVRNQVELDGDAAALFAYPGEGCLVATVDPDTKVVAVTYDAAPAALVLEPPSGDVQVVDLYLCGDRDPRRSITLTAP